MTRTRWLALLAAALLLPSCDSHHGNRLRVGIHNAGAEVVDARAEVRYLAPFRDDTDRDDVSIAPGETSRLVYHADDAHELRVRVFRTSDDAEIYDRTWDREDLDDLDWEVSVSVSP